MKIRHSYSVTIIIVLFCFLQELREALEKSTTKEMNAHNTEGHAPIHSLIKRSCVTEKEKLKRMDLLVTLLTYGDVEVDQMNSEGNTALHMAVMVGPCICRHMIDPNYTLNNNCDKS